MIQKTLEAERQALALMDHPNFAKIFDAGATQSGRPYFVMELVRGTKITEYCDQHSLTTEERLKLFVQYRKGRGISAPMARETIDQAGKLEDADIADIFTEISRGIDKWLWFVEAHGQASR